MKKIFVFENSLMNGTVTCNTEIAAFTSRDLAEDARQAIRAANCMIVGGYRMYLGEVEEINVYESKEEIPFFKKQRESV